MVLSGLMDKIVEEGRRFAATSDMKIADMSSNAPVGTTLAILERTLKVMSAVQARVHYSMKQELQLLAGIIRDYTDDEYTYEPEDAHRMQRKRTIVMLKSYLCRTPTQRPSVSVSFSTKPLFNWHKWRHTFTTCQFYTVRCWRCSVLSTRISWYRLKKTRSQLIQFLRTRMR
jgi:hypothetical protein